MVLAANPVPCTIDFQVCLALIPLCPDRLGCGQFEQKATLRRQAPLSS